MSFLGKLFICIVILFGVPIVILGDSVNGRHGSSNDGFSFLPGLVSIVILLAWWGWRKYSQAR